MSSNVVGGGIQQNIPRKNNVLPTAAPGRSPFPLNTAGHDEILGYEGTAYTEGATLRQMSEYIVSDIPPLSNQFSNATLPQVPPLQATHAGSIVPVNQFTRINPNEKAVLHTSGKKRTVARKTGGPSPHSDTPFHPAKPSPPPVHRTRPSAIALKTFHVNVAKAGSFHNTGAATGTLFGHAHHDQSADRWSTVKKGAAG